MIERVRNQAPLIYYSYRQIIEEEFNTREVNAANKITIRKHSNFEEDGLEFLVYNCALSSTPDLCNGVRQTSILNNGECVDFRGKGLSSNGIPLDNVYGCFFDREGMLELVTAKTNRKYIYRYLNCYRQEHHIVFAKSLAHITEFFRSTYQLLCEETYDPFNNVWFGTRACVLSYYSEALNWYTCPFPFASDEEWEYMHQVASDELRLKLLSHFEKTLDMRFYDAFQHFKEGNKMVFRKELDKMIVFLGVYYLLYDTLS